MAHTNISSKKYFSSLEFNEMYGKHGADVSIMAQWDSSLISSLQEIFISVNDK